MFLRQDCTQMFSMDTIFQASYFTVMEKMFYTIVLIYAHTCAHTHACAHMRMLLICMHMYICIHTHTHTHACTHTCTHTHACTRMHMHALSWVLAWEFEIEKGYCCGSWSFFFCSCPAEICCCDLFSWWSLRLWTWNPTHLSAAYGSFRVKISILENRQF